MSFRKLDFVSSIQVLNDAKMEVKHTDRGSVKVFITIGDHEVTVTRNQLVKKIEQLAKKALDQNDFDVFREFQALKNKIINLESIKVKGALASIRHFFANLFVKNRKERLERIEREFKSLEKLPRSHQSTTSKSQSEEASSAFSSTSDEETLLLDNQPLNDVISSKKVQDFFGTSDLSVLKKLFIQNSANRKSSFSIGEKIFKLRGERIYLKKEKIAEGSTATIYKIDELCLKTFNTLHVVRKKSKEKAANEIRHEYQMLNRVGVDVFNSGEFSLMDAFQGAPHRIINKTKKENDESYKDQAYIDGPRYSGDAFDYMVQHSFDPKACLKAFDLMIQGVAFLQKKEIIHVDIKLENIFVEELENGEVRFRLADFGGAYYFDEVENLSDCLPFTPSYTPLSEIPLPDRPLEELSRLSTFQLGLALYLAFTANYPYPFTSSKYLDLTQDQRTHFINMQESEKIPEAAIEFILALLDPNPEKRPIGEDLRLAWEEAKKQMPELF